MRIVLSICLVLYPATATKASARIAARARVVEILAFDEKQSSTVVIAEKDAQSPAARHAVVVDFAAAADSAITEPIGPDSAQLADQPSIDRPPERGSQTHARSPIPVPGWMDPRAVLSRAYFPTTRCGPAPYRPAGFLKAALEARRARYYGAMSAVACEHGLPTGLFDAMIIQESRYDPLAMSPREAFGLTQLMPGTSQDLGVDAHDPVQNLRGGARYLRTQIDRFGQVHLALAAYNAGPARVRNGAVPAIAETQRYVAAILANWVRISGATYPSGTPYSPARQRPEGQRIAVTTSF